MAWNETPITVVGTVVTDVMHRYTADGVPFTTFRIGSTERRYNRDSQEWEDGDSVYLGVACWRRLAENAGAALAKGDPVIVHGRLRLKHQDADGQRRAHYNIDAVSIGIDLGRCRALRNVPEAPGVVAPRTEEESVTVATNAEPETIPF